MKVKTTKEIKKQNDYKYKTWIESYEMTFQLQKLKEEVERVTSSINLLIDCIRLAEEKSKQKLRGKKE